MLQCTRAIHNLVASQAPLRGAPTERRPCKGPLGQTLATRSKLGPKRGKRDRERISYGLDRMKNRVPPEQVAALRKAGTFDDEWYLKQYPDVRALGMDPIEHYLWIGVRLNRLPSENYDKNVKNSPSINPVLMIDDDCEYRKQYRELFSRGFPSPTRRSLVSIIIAVYNKIDMTLKCLQSIMHNTSCDYEVLLVNDNSSDKSCEILSKIPNLRLINNSRNIGYLLSNNKAAKVSSGEYIALLNNDIEVAPDWLSSLLDLAQADARVGAVGSKLIYPDGKLQEAGGIYWSDARGANCGRGGDPDAPEHNYVREVDKCSAASLLIRRSIFMSNGEGYDPLFAPAYKEDADLCFRVRQLGFKVMYQPKSIVVHYEGASHGTDVESGIKRYQELNRPKFVEKWSSVLSADHFENRRENAIAARERPHGRPVALIIDDRVPEHDKHAGGMGMFHYVKLMIDIGFRVVFYPDNKKRLEPYTSQLQQLGVEVWYGSSPMSSLLDKYADQIEICWLSRPNESNKYIDLIRKRTKSKILYCGRDLHYLRTRRRGEIEGDQSLILSAVRLEEIEKGLFEKSDLVLSFSSAEHDIISGLVGEKKCRIVSPYVFSTTSTDLSNGENRSDVVFVGGFNHSPNRDAVSWFLENCWAGIKAELPDLRFVVVGSDPSDKLLRWQSEDIVFAGHVPDLTPVFEKALLSVAPLRFGAGVKGKIITSLSYGCPVVSSPLGVEGMMMNDRENVLIAQSPDEFNTAVKLLHSNRALRSALIEGGKRYVDERYSVASVQRNFVAILRELGVRVPEKAR